MEYSDTTLEIKEISEAGAIEGLAAAIGNVDNGGDRIMPGAFTKSLMERGRQGLPMLLNHDLKRPIGVWHSLNETSAGLLVKGKLTMATRDAQEAYALARDGALTGLSIGYKGEGRYGADGVRELQQVQLFEASLVPIPMNDRTRITSIKTIGEAKDIADLLRERGMSSRQAKAAAGAAWKAINDKQNEPDPDELRAILRASVARIGTI